MQNPIIIKQSNLKYQFRKCFSQELYAFLILSVFVVVANYERKISILVVNDVGETSEKIK